MKEKWFECLSFQPFDLSLPSTLSAVIWLLLMVSTIEPIIAQFSSLNNVQSPDEQFRDDAQMQLQELPSPSQAPPLPLYQNDNDEHLINPQFQLPNKKRTQTTTNAPKLMTRFDTLLRDIGEGSERFAINLFKETLNDLEKTNSSNFIISPFSIWSLLTTLVEGAEGETLNQLQKVLGLTNDINNVRETYRIIQSSLDVNTSAVELYKAQVFVTDAKRPLRTEFKTQIFEFYKTDLVDVDFSNAEDAFVKINTFINRTTNGQIKQAISKKDLENTQLMLISGMFFRGNWMIPFNTSFTKEEQFYDENENSIDNVNMMFVRGVFPYAAVPAIDSLCLELPYGSDNHLSMILFMPRKGVTLSSVVEKLANIRLQVIYDELQKAAYDFEDDEVEVHLPRFKIKSDYTLNVILERLGLKDIFNVERADLRKLTDNPIYLSRVFHKAKIEVDEEGTVASSVTSAQFANKATPPRFYANRPFAFLIVDKLSNLVIFMGQVKDPKTFKF